MKKFIYTVGLAVLLAACSSDKPKTEAAEQDAYANEESAPAEAVDNGKGVGPVKSVTLAGLDKDKAGKGKAIYEMKCQACHRLDGQKVVGPGWKDVTKRRQPEWIMNMILNVDEMLQKDPEAIKLVEAYLMKMPNQNVSEEEAYQILEFMRQNDGVQ
jgi:mono/diheme cytochrome c family protein